jgi:hypothetical protein
MPKRPAFKPHTVPNFTLSHAFLNEMASWFKSFLSPAKSNAITTIPGRRVCNPNTEYTPHYFNHRLSPTATENDIKKSYKDLLRLVHPDRNGAQKEAAVEATMLLNEDIRVLSRDKRIKQGYDAIWWQENYRWEQKRYLHQAPERRSWFREYEQVRGKDALVHPL